MKKEVIIAVKKFTRKAILVFAGGCGFLVAYFLLFFICSGIFHAEHWSFIAPLFPAFFAMMAIMGVCDE